MRRLTLVLLIFIFGTLPALKGYAQLTREEFGESRVQYKNFHWRYLSSESFDVYYYDNGDKIADAAIKYLDGEFDRITDVLGYSPYSKTKIFLYNSIADLQQSNALPVGVIYVAVHIACLKRYVFKRQHACNK